MDTPRGTMAWIGAEVHATRLSVGLTQSALARRSGLARGTIRAVEHPAPGWRPTFRVALALTTALDLPADTVTALHALARPEPGALARMRVAAGWTQNRLATALGISQSTYHRYETGVRLPPPQIRSALAALLGDTPEGGLRPDP